MKTLRILVFVGKGQVVHQKCFEQGALTWVAKQQLVDELSLKERRRGIYALRMMMMQMASYSSPARKRYAPREWQPRLREAKKNEKLINVIRKHHKLLKKRSIGSRRCSMSSAPRPCPWRALERSPLSSYLMWSPRRRQRTRCSAPTLPCKRC